MKSYPVLLLLPLISGSSLYCKGQPAFGTDKLRLEKSIALPGVKGRIDHLDVNLKDQVVYVAALGNNTLEAVDLRTGKVIHSITGLDEPQGVGYIPQTGELFVANGGSGDCYFYNAHSFEKTGSVHLSGDADDVRYDSVEKKIYVGYGEGGIAVIDAGSHKQTGDVKLPAHPESFQLDKKLDRLFVNVPNANMVAAISLSQLKLTDKWTRESPAANFPMAIDTTGHRVFVGYRRPARLLVLKGASGKELSLSPMTGDADDLYYDAATGDVLISGGAGSISLFHAQDQQGFSQIANIPTRSGARTSLLIPSLRLFVVAARAGSGREAELLVYHL